MPRHNTITDLQNVAATTGADPLAQAPLATTTEGIEGIEEPEAAAAGAAADDDRVIIQRASAALEALDAEERAIETRQCAADDRLEALAAQEQAVAARTAAARRAHAVSVQAAAERAAHLALATAGTTNATLLRDHLTRLEAERDAAERDLAAAEAAAECDQAEMASEDERILAEQRRDAQRLTEIASEREIFQRLGAEAHERLGVATQAEVDAELAAQQARIAALQGELRAAEVALRQTREDATERLDAWPERAAAYRPKRQRATLHDLAQRWYELATWLEDHGHEIAQSAARRSEETLSLLQGQKLDMAFAITSVDLQGLLTGAIKGDRDGWGQPDLRFAEWRHKLEMARRCAQEG